MKSPLSGIKKYQTGGYVEDEYAAPPALDNYGDYSQSDDDTSDYADTTDYDTTQTPLSSVPSSGRGSDKFFALTPALGYKNSSIPVETRNRMALEAARAFFAPTSSAGGFFESASKALGGVSSVMEETEKQRRLLEQLAQKNATAQEMNKERVMARLSAAEMGAKSREEVARINAAARQAALSDAASGRTARTLTQDEVKQLGLPAGTIAQQVDKTGRINILHSPSAAQLVKKVVGYDENGMPVYSEEAPLSKRVTADMQKYVANATNVLPDLDALIEQIEQKKIGQSALGISGGIQRGLESTIGQAKSLATGETTPLFPEETGFRNKLKELNERLIPALTSDPRISVKTRNDVKKMLADPDNIHEDLPSALTKMKSIRDQLAKTSEQYTSQLGGTPTTLTPKQKNNPFEGMSKEEIAAKIRSMTPEERKALHDRMTGNE